MDNAVKWVDTYFGKQELNRMYRKAKNPPYLDRIYKRYQATQRKILQSPGEILKEDPTRYLNWMLNELSTAEIALAAPTDRTSIGTTLDQNLPDDALHHIRLTDGKSNGTSGLVFRADTGQVFDERWPYLLRDPDFAPTRERAERAQQAFLGEIGEQGEFSLNSAQELRTSIDELAALYARKYPFEEVLRSEDRELIRFYWIGRRFLQQRAANAARAIITNDLRVLDGTFRIEDTSVVTLIRNLCQNGLQFAPPTPGDEPTYRDLFRKMRHIYEDHADRTARFDASPIQN